MGILTLPPTDACAQEVDPRIEYVEKLQEMGLAELAVDYLRSLSADGTQGELESKLNYYLGKSLLAQAEGAPRDREAGLIQEGLASLQKFLQSDSQSEQAIDARSEIVRVDIARSERLIAEARLSSDPQERASKRQKGRATIDRAGPELDHLIKQYQGMLDAERKRDAESTTGRRRRAGAGRQRGNNKLRTLEAKTFDLELRRGQIDYLASLTFDRSVPEEKKQADARLEQGAQRFNELFQRQRSRGTLAASLALLWEGRVRQELGDRESAVEIYEEVLGGEPAQTTGVDAVQEEIFGQARLFWCQVKNQSQQPEEVIFNRFYSAVTWLDRSPDRRRERFGLGIQLELAKAYFAVAEKPSTSAVDQKKNMRAAVKLLNDYVCRYGSEFMPEGFALREKYASRAVDTDDSMASFDEAMFAGTTAWSAKDWPKAAIAFEKALSLAGKETTQEQIDQAKLRLGHARILSGRADEGLAAALELAEAQPSRKSSAEAAGLIVSTIWKAWNGAPKGSAEKAAEEEKLMVALDRAKKRFPKSSQADTARFLTGFLHAEKRAFEQAGAAYLEVSADSDLFAESRLRAGQMMWNLFLDEQSAKKPDPARADQAIELFRSAQKAYSSKSASPDEPVLGSVEASLWEARVLRATARERESLQVMEPLVGLVKENRPAGIDRLAVDILVAATESALAAGSLDLGEQFVDIALNRENSAGGRMTQVLVRLGQSLEEDVRRLEKAGESSQAAARRTSLTSFLEKLAARQDQDLVSIRFLAESFESMGDYRRAAELLDRGLKRLSDDKDGLPAGEKEKLRTQFEVRRVRALRQSGEFSQASQEVDRLLTEHRAKAKTYPLALEREKCEILESWAQKETQRGAEALSAWTKLADRLRSSSPKPKDYFAARLAMARWTAKMKGPAEGAALIRSTLALHPDGGGVDLKQEMERLQREWSAGAGK